MTGFAALLLYLECGEHLSMQLLYGCRITVVHLTVLHQGDQAARNIATTVLTLRRVAVTRVQKLNPRPIGVCNMELKLVRTA